MANMGQALYTIKKTYEDDWSNHHHIFTKEFDEWVTDDNSIATNGLYFYSSVGQFDPIDESFGNGPLVEKDQTEQLRDRIAQVLDIHYGEEWKTDSTKKIVLFGHSQGGLLCRNLYRRFTSGSLTNPINHVERIITLGTPHIGSPWASSNAYHPLDDYIDLAENFIQDFKNAGYNAEKLENMLVYNKRFDENGDFLQVLNSSPFPKNLHDNADVPIVALYSQAKGVTHKIHNALKLDLTCTSGEIDSWKNSAIALLFIAPGDIISQGLAQWINFEIQKDDVLFEAICTSLNNWHGTINSYLNLVLSDFEETDYEDPDAADNTSWSEYSDFVVPVPSQAMSGLYPGAPVFRKQVKKDGEPITHIPMPLDVMTQLIPGQKVSTDHVYGQVECWESAIEAIEMDVAVKDLSPILNLLLLD
jgi:hypothetical protein